MTANVTVTVDPPPPEVANLFSAVVIVALVTTILTPFILKLVFAESGDGPREDSG